MNVSQSGSVTAPADARRRRLFALSDPTSWVVLCGTAIIAAITIGTIFVVGHFRERAIERSELELEGVSRILAQHFDRKFDELSASANFIATYVEQQKLSPEEAAKILPGEHFLEMLKDAVSGSADTSSRISIFDQNGKLIVSSDLKSSLPIDISTRNYFKALKAQGLDTDTTRIELVENNFLAEKRVVLARRISTADGQLLGVLTRTLLASQLDRFLSSIAFKDRTILLVGDVSDVLARHPRPPAAAGDDFFDSPLLDHVTAAGTATLRLLEPRTGSQNIISARRLARYPLTVIAATTVSDALTSWRDETRTLILVAGLAAIVVGIMLIVIVRHLKEQTRRLDVAINNMPQALLLFDPLERLIVKNSRYSEVLGCSEHVATGRRFKDIIRDCQSNGTPRPGLDAYIDSVRDALWQNGRTQRTVKMSDGRFLQIVNQALDEGGWVSTIEDITGRHRSEELTVRLAQFDSLTGLPNRISFMTHLRRELAAGDHGLTLAVLFLDLDDFKTVNDTLGHHIGDLLLKCVALELKMCLGAGEFVARLGGDEFAIVSSLMHGRDGVLELTNRLYDALRRPHDCAGHTLTIDGSIGVALAPTDGETCEAILQSADLAMYAAKSLGKKAYRFFEPEMEARARERLLLEAELRRALVEGEIETYFQPIYDLERRCVVACEALARWRHSERGVIPPAVFIPIAEQAGLISQLGDLVLRQACQEATSWPDDVTVAVNVSAIQLRNPVFALKVISALHESGLRANRLEMEITEAVLISDDETALKILHELRSVGVRIALDDFGTGYSALSYLLRFPFDKLKIDRCFVDRLTDCEKSRGIVKAAITMASELRMVTTAEGVETQAQRDLLRKLKCDQIQGYLIAPALPTQAIRELLNGAMRYQA